MERLSNKYPDNPDLLRVKIDFLESAGAEDYDLYLEASITARQFAVAFNARNYTLVLTRAKTRILICNIRKKELIKFFH